MYVDIVSKSVVSVTEMAKMTGLSRARFYQLVRAGTFPQPDKEPCTGRPFFSEDKQRLCLDVRRRNCGIDGKPILFYSRRCDLGQTKVKARPAKIKADPHADLLDGLKALGLLNVSSAQVDIVVKELFPNGVAGADLAEVIRAVFLRLRRQDSVDNVG